MSTEPDRRLFYRPRRDRRFQVVSRLAMLAGAVAFVVIAATGGSWELYVLAGGLVATALAPGREVSYRDRSAWERVLIYLGLR